MPQQIPRGRPDHARDHPGPDGPQKRRGDPERDARRFRPTRPPAPRATSAAGTELIIATGTGEDQSAQESGHYPAGRTGPATTNGT